jgi:peptide/nickel transport system permease protein
MLSQNSPSADIVERRQQALGLDEPLRVQYGRYLTGLASGDLGVSWFGDQPVSTLLSQQLRATLSLALSSLVVALIAGLVLGIPAAAGRDSWISQISRAFTGVLLALPVIFTGIILIWVFSINLGWVPATGQGGIRHLVLPALVVGMSVGGGIARAVDAGVSEVLGQPFMRAAVAKGLSRWGALFRHGLRVGLLPVVDVIALQFGYLVGGTVITESLFARQGVGRLLVGAILNKDVPVVLGVVTLSIVSYSLLNLLADIIHTWLDPRVRLDG